MAKGMRVFFTAMWRTILLRGAASLIFGLSAFLYPGITLAVVVTIFGLYALADGLIGLWSQFRAGQEGRSVPSMLNALASIAAGVVCLSFPDFAVVYVVLLIGLWNVAAGLMQLLGAIALRREIDHALWLGLSGLIGAGLGVLIMLYPADGAISILWIIAGTAILVGLVLIVFALKLRSAGRALAG
ncbi:HdeD family acid-resistance protein [Aestuariivirga sp.]|uniref:HdeD family acid-resistance protein n=1 Tax=Aestuariivirga sp. TaxID=2650926 RepID=UPI00391BD2BC